MWLEGSSACVGVLGVVTAAEVVGDLVGEGQVGHRAGADADREGLALEGRPDLVHGVGVTAQAGAGLEDRGDEVGGDGVPQGGDRRVGLERQQSVVEVGERRELGEAKVEKPGDSPSKVKCVLSVSIISTGISFHLLLSYRTRTISFARPLLRSNHFRSTLNLMTTEETAVSLMLDFFMIM